jgi:hypothetical protein
VAQASFWRLGGMAFPVEHGDIGVHVGCVGIY